MKLLINMSNNLGGGGLQVGLSFIQECIKFKENDYVIAISEKNANLITFQTYPQNFSFHIVKYTWLWQINRKMKKIEKKVKPDIVFSIFGPTYWTPRVPHIMGFAIPHYIYSSSPFFKLCSIKERIKISLKKIIHVKLIKNEADCIITETEDASKRVKQLLNDDNISYKTVSNTCSSFFLNYNQNSESNRILPVREETEFRFLYLSKYYTHKNFEIIPKIVENLINQNIHNIRFILSIDSESYERLISDKYKKYVRNVGFVPMNKAPCLYSEIDAIIQPSFLEVFSANYVEAMVMKKPIFASDYSFAHTVCGDAALYFNPLNLSETTSCIISFINDNELRNSLVEKGQNRLKSFDTAEDRARKYLDICKSIIESSQQ